MIYIYCIFDADLPIYIGKTKNPINTRKNQHQRRLSKILEIIELDLVPKENWKYWEIYWIEQFRQWGFNILNKNTGGGGPEFHTNESLSKMRGRKHLGTSEKLKGINRPDTSIRKLGVSLSKETCNKISEAKKGHICYSNIERNNKIKEGNKSHYLPNSERNRKISEKLKGKKKNKIINQ